VDRGPFVLVKRITGNLFSDDSLLPGLIAAMSRAATDDLLLVYVGPKPDQVRAGIRAISADQLRAEVLTSYDGPTIGLAQIDQIRPDIGTKGSYFVRLDRILRRRGHGDLLRRTWAMLGDYLATYLDELPDGDARQKLSAEIASIRAPAQIARIPRERRRGLVAFIPATGEAVGLDELACDGVPLSDLSRLAAHPDQDVLMFEELRPLLRVAAVADPVASYPLELRTILRRGLVDQELDETLRQLALAFHARWRMRGDPADLQRAYAIALECRLVHRDVDDLIAVIPGPDFEPFLADGAGTYVYRCPLEGASGEGDECMVSRRLDDAIEDLASPAAPVVFTLLPLRNLCGPAASWCDLGPALRKCKRTEILARNAWLLVEDLVKERERGRLRPAVTTRDLQETMVRCSVIFSLTDPWRTRQGRRDEWVQGSYRTLAKVIQIREEEHSSAGHAGYFEALEHWYGCALAADDDDIESALNTVVERLERSEAHVSADPRPDLVADAGQLMAVAEPLRELLRGGARAEAYEVLNAPPVRSIPQVVRQATDMAEPIGLLSVPFGASFREFAALQERIRRVNTTPMGVRDKTERLADLAAQLERCQRLIFAPQHEARILHALFGKVLKATVQFISALRGGAAVELKLRTRSVELGEESRMLFSVRNVGSLAAREVELELVAAESFELLDQTYKQSLSRLAPDEEHAFMFRIRCVTDAPEFRIRCQLSWSHGAPEHGDSERAERQQVTQDFGLSTIGPQSQPFSKKPNPYVYGVHVEDHRRFFGRRAELDELLGHLAHGGAQNVLLRAPRRAGKTSLLHMVRSVLADTDRVAGVRDWFAVPTSWDANLNATVPVFLNLQGIEDLQMDATPTAFYQAVLGGLREAGLRGPTSDRLLSEPSVSYTQFTRGLREMVAAAGSRRPVILLDEFDVLDTMADKVAFYSALRTVVAEVQGVTWIVVSALGLYKEIRDYASPLFNIFKIVTMGRMDAEAARRLVTSPWEPGGSQADASLSFLPDAVYAILEETGNYPYFIQMLCSEVVDFVNVTHTSRVRLSTVQQVVERKMVAEGGAADLTFDYMWHGASPTGKLLLLTLLHRDLAMAHDELRMAARGLLESRGRADLVGKLLAQFDDSLTRLTYMDAVRHVPGAGYAFGVPIFRGLLVRKAERTDLEATTIDELQAAAQ